MFKQVLSLLVLILLLACNDASPHNTTVVSSTREGNSTCGSTGQVTNINIQGGVAGLQGERGEMGPQGLRGPSGGGVSYTRWGRTTCPTTQGTQLVYQGKMAGSKWNEPGSSNYLCLHNELQFLQVTAGVQSVRGYLYGTEYDAVDSPPAFGTKLGHNAPCSVCYTSGRSTTITIPGRTSCPDSWTREYYGYLMADRSYTTHGSGRAPVCVDVDSESVAGGETRRISSMLFFLEVRCLDALCPAYLNGVEVTCAVCTK